MNRRTGIMVAGGSRARFISVELPVDEVVDGGPRLVEHVALGNPEGELPPRGLFSDRSGRAHTASIGVAHGLDDHRDQHQAEIERRFARSLCNAAYDFVGERSILRLVMIAEPQLLGKLRAELDSKRWRDVELVELAEDLSRHSLRQIQAALAQRGLCERARTPASSRVYRPRGQEPVWR